MMVLPVVDRLYVYDNSVDGQDAKLQFRLAKDIARYFLANAQTFRGADAKRLKAELKILINQ